MKFTNAVPALALATMLAFTGAVAAAPADASHSPVASATLAAADGSPRGKAWIVAHDGRWELKVDAEGLPAGAHGTHLHMVGKCEAPGFTTAGDHLNPHGRQHGSENPQGMHLGDLPNLTAGADGKGSLTAPLQGTPAELQAALFDADGTAVVIHAAADDYRTDPSGNSGSRIACGVLTPGR